MLPVQLRIFFYRPCRINNTITFFRDSEVRFVASLENSYQLPLQSALVASNQNSHPEAPKLARASISLGNKT